MQIFIGYVLGQIIISKLCSKLYRSSASWITKDAALDGIINANGTISQSASGFVNETYI